MKHKFWIVSFVLAAIPWLVIALFWLITPQSFEMILYEITRMFALVVWPIVVMVIAVRRSAYDKSERMKTSALGRTIDVYSRG